MKKSAHERKGISFVFTDEMADACEHSEEPWKCVFPCAHVQSILDGEAE